MTGYNLPALCRALLFDMDCTLYTHPEYAQAQIDLPVARLAELRGKSFDEVSGEVADFRKKWAAKNKGQAISLGNIFAAFGIPIQESVRWREELYQPESYLSRDARLAASLQELSAHFALAVVTNNPAAIAKRTLSVLGVSDFFCAIVGLDTCFVSKPDKAPFNKAAELCKADAEACISVGDRYDIDIALPLDMGMGGILVDGVKDVYKLPDFLHAVGLMPPTSTA
ncbi:MAG: HAD family hydrolase [Spirochaetes bacterium]|nr:HAD family hydrolase [Spirochaetota bacterium]